jgi:hypothetical protein
LISQTGVAKGYFSKRAGFAIVEERLPDTVSLKVERGNIYPDQILYIAWCRPGTSGQKMLESSKDAWVESGHRSSIQIPMLR